MDFFIVFAGMLLAVLVVVTIPAWRGSRMWSRIAFIVWVVGLTLVLSGATIFSGS